MPMARWIPPLLLVGLLACWSGALRAPFLLDDLESVLGNTTIRELWSGAWLIPPSTGGETVSGRPLLNLSFALNYAIGGLAPWGYHLGNLLIHALAALLLYGLVRRTLRACGFAEGRACWLALAAGACWSLHPLQTGAVTYVSQRAESMAGLFVLATLYGFLRSVGDPRHGRRWMVGAVLCCILGCLTKEPAAAAPLLVLFYDRVFVSGSFFGAWRARRGYYSALAVGWGVLLVLGVTNPGRGGSAGFGTEIGPWSYFLVQCSAIPRYLGLVFWPSGQIFDYGVDTVFPFAPAFPGLLFLAAAAAAAGCALLRGRAEGFLGAAFFVLLAPSSSVIPVVTQTRAEHRMYLALAAVLLLAGTILHRLLAGRRGSARLAVPGALALAVPLAVLTWRRNQIYETDLSIWADTVAKRPNNPRARNNLGVALAAAGRTGEAKAEYAQAIALRPNHAMAHFNLGTLLLTEGRLAEAYAQFSATLAADPRHVGAWIDRGQALAGLGRGDEAVADYRRALELEPGARDAAVDLAALLLPRGRLDEAERLLRGVLAAEPSLPEARYYWGRLCWRRGDSSGAVASYREAVRLRPAYAAAHRAIGEALLDRGDEAGAEASLREALRLDPRDAETLYMVGNLNASGRHFGEAMEAYRAALALMPGHIQARTNLGNCQLVTGDLRGAVATYEEVLRRRPGEPTAQANLALAREHLGR